MKKGKLYILLAVLILMLVLSQSVCKTVTKLTSETMIEKAYAATLDVTSFHISMCNNITGEGENEQCMEGDF